MTSTAIYDARLAAIDEAVQLITILGIDVDRARMGRLHDYRRAVAHERKAAADLALAVMYTGQHVPAAAEYYAAVRECQKDPADRPSASAPDAAPAAVPEAPGKAATARTQRQRLGA